MARNKGTFQFAANFEVKLQGALDPRILVDNKSELINKETWPYDGDTIYVYNGLLVAVAADKAIYMLVDKDKILSADYSGWKQMDVAAAQTVEIIDNLSSTSTTAALSANQGRALGQRVTTLESKIASVYSYKGSKATYAELPTNAAAGDVWNVEEAHDNHPAGTNWAWTGTAWDALGGVIDLSSYYNKTQVDSAIDAKVNIEKSARESADTELDGKITTNTQAIAKINGDASTDGSIANAIKQAKDYADTKTGDLSDKLADKVDKVKGSSLIPNAKLTLIDTNASDIAALEVRVAANEAKLAGITTTVVEAISSAMAWHEVTE